MLKRDDKAGFRWRMAGLFNRRRLYKYYAGRYSSRAEFTDEQVNAILTDASDQPHLIMQITGTRRCYWIFDGVSYWEEDGLRAEDVRALIVSREQAKQWKLDRAHQIASQGSVPARATARRISAAVQQLVWERDRGRCVACGSQVALEFDHIIPVARGGSSSEKNVQLLCRDCNRSKRDRIG